MRTSLPVSPHSRIVTFFVFILMAAAAFAQPKGPEQPIPYSHKVHIANGLKCNDCHTVATPPPESGEDMMIPATAKCMTCHRAIKKDSPAIQKLAKFDQDKQPVPWVRIYKVPDFVFFNHASHLKAGAACERCHGQVAQRDQLYREVSLSMSTCVDCHREKKADESCTFCHEER